MHVILSYLSAEHIGVLYPGFTFLLFGKCWTQWAYLVTGRSGQLVTKDIRPPGATIDPALLDAPGIVPPCQTTGLDSLSPAGQSNTALFISPSTVGSAILELPPTTALQAHPPAPEFVVHILYSKPFIVTSHTLSVL